MSFLRVLSPLPHNTQLQLAQQANTPNFTHMLNEVSRHVAFVVRACLDRGIDAVEPTQAAEDAWVADVMSFAPFRRQFDQECTPGYYNNEGHPDGRNREWFLGYPAGAMAFFQHLDRWRSSGDWA